MIQSEVNAKFLQESKNFLEIGLILVGAKERIGERRGSFKCSGLY